MSIKSIGKVWRVSDGECFTDYIRANSLDDAKTIFDARHYNKGVEFQVIDETIHAVYFSDSNNPAYFKGTKADALNGGKVYVRRWGLDAKIDRIITI